MVSKYMINVENQYFNFDNFIKDIEVLVIMVAHDEIKMKKENISNLLILDTRNILNGKNVYKL